MVKLLLNTIESEQHSVEIESIKNIVESANEIALFDVNEEKNMFRFYIKIPLSHE